MLKRPDLVTLPCTTKRRFGVVAKCRLIDGRVIGDLYWPGGRHVRSFNVKLRDDNTIMVDVGTCSGVKVRFKWDT